MHILLGQKARAVNLRDRGTIEVLKFVCGGDAGLRRSWFRGGLGRRHGLGNRRSGCLLSCRWLGCGGLRFRLLGSRLLLGWWFRSRLLGSRSWLLRLLRLIRWLWTLLLLI